MTQGVSLMMPCYCAGDLNNKFVTRTNELMRTIAWTRRKRLSNFTFFYYRENNLF